MCACAGALQTGCHHAELDLNTLKSNLQSVVGNVPTVDVFCAIDVCIRIRLFVDSFYNFFNV